MEPLTFDQAVTGGVVNMVPHGPPPPGLPAGVIGGEAVPVLTRATFPALIKMMFMVGALETHHENQATAKHADVAEQLNAALMQLFMMVTKQHGGDCQANFDYWMERVVPEEKP